jgi:cyclophilin family peptidyl-prolyl cis-trans isomerase
MNKLIIPIIIVVAIVAYFGFQNANKPAETNTNSNSEKVAESEAKVNNLKFPGVLPDEKIKNKKAVVKTAKGTIEFELYADKAPKTVSNFVYLTEKSFYNNLNFHRVEPGFVIQGGDPAGNGTGGPGYKFPDEPVQGDYKAGTVAMANSGPNTNGSQFFICLDDLPTLPKQYNLFGQVTAGMDVVKQIAVNDKIESITIVNK